MKKFLIIALMIIIGTLGGSSETLAQTPLATCNSCGTSDGWELYVGGTYTAIDHWYDGNYDQFYDLEIDSDSRVGHEYKLTTLLEVPFKWEYISGLVVGLEYYSRERENFLVGYDWNDEGISFTVGARLKF